MSLNVWVRQDDPAYSVAQILDEEMKHVQYWQTMSKWATRRGEQLEGHSFPTCGNATTRVRCTNK